MDRLSSIKRDVDRVVDMLYNGQAGEVSRSELALVLAYYGAQMYLENITDRPNYGNTSTTLQTCIIWTFNDMLEDGLLLFYRVQEGGLSVEIDLACEIAEDCLDG